MVDRCGQLAEEPLEAGEVGGIEGRRAGPEFEADTLNRSALRAVMDQVRAVGPESRAVSRPIPAVPPITRTVRPSSLFH